jgi:hypothetical protein
VAVAKIRRPTVVAGLPGGDRGEFTVKKLMLLLVAGAAGFMLWRKLEADKAEQALWAEVTDPVK